MDNIASCLTSLLSMVNQCVPHAELSHKETEEYNTKDKNTLAKDSDSLNQNIPSGVSVTYIAHQEINIDKVVIDMTSPDNGSNSSTTDNCRDDVCRHVDNDYNDDEINARMNFFKANSP